MLPGGQTPARPVAGRWRSPGRSGHVPLGFQAIPHALPTLAVDRTGCSSLLRAETPACHLPGHSPRRPSSTVRGLCPLLGQQRAAPVPSPEGESVAVSLVTFARNSIPPLISSTSWSGFSSGSESSKSGGKGAAAQGTWAGDEGDPSPGPSAGSQGTLRGVVTAQAGQWAAGEGPRVPAEKHNRPAPLRTFLLDGEVVHQVLHGKLPIGDAAVSLRYRMKLLTGKATAGTGP